MMPLPRGSRMGSSMAREKKYKIIVSSVAYDDLNAHVYFLARVNGSAARRLKTTIMRDIRSLGTMPERGSSYDRPYLPAGRYLYKLSAERYRVVYTIDGDTVFVDGVEDCRQDNENSRPGEK